MSLSLAKEVYFNRMEKGSLMEANELELFLKDEKDLALNCKEKEELKKWLHDQKNLSPLEILIKDPSINEILIHTQNRGQVDRNGELVQVDFHSQDISFEQLFEVLALRENQSWNYQKPFRSFRVELMGEIFRATLLHRSLSPDLEPKLFLRRLRTNQITLDHFDLEEQEKQFLLQILREKKNILFSGATGSGKTSLLSALLAEISSKEHVVLLEDTHEISLKRDYFTYLLAEEEIPKKTLKDYCKYAMRLRPDRLIIGELRGEESVPFLLSMNNGHKGLMSTIHADKASDAPMRLSMLFSLYSDTVNMNLELVLKLVCANVDYVVHMENKRIKEVVLLLGSEGSTPYFEKIF